MSELRTLGYQETVAILAGPWDISDGLVARIGLSRPDPAYPGPELPALVAPGAFNQALETLMTDKGPAGLQKELSASRRATYDHMVALGSSSLLMAHMLAADIPIPRPRRLHEHTQSALNIHAEYMTELYQEPRDRLLPAIHFFKNIGMSYAVPIHLASRNKDQAVHNSWVTTRLLESSILSPDEKTVVQLHVEEEAIGRTLRQYTEKGRPFDEALAEGHSALQGLLSRCPASYRDRFMFQLAGVTFADMAAHTQRAYYVSAEDGTIRQNVTDRDRYKDGDVTRGETNNTLDRLFSEAHEDARAIRFKGAARIAVIRGLFPEHYEQFVSQITSG
jgi:hypothetical protein